jgi:glycosyltransferase involved in cell wall biosynthesis
MLPKVSIILNIYNGSATLAETLDSVFAQTYLDWELIAWDDCSTDSSRDVVAQYRDARVRYILSPERISLGQARDKAIREARGEWLAFLDQDDIWIPSKLADQLAVGDMDISPRVGFVYGRALIFGDAQSERDYDHRHEYRPLPEGRIFEDLFRDSCFIAMSSLLFRKSLFYEIGGIPHEFEVAPDYYLLVAGAHRYPVRVIQWVICKYRVHAGAMSRLKGPQIQCEAMAIVHLWSHCLDSALVSRRLRIHSSVLAFYEMLHVSSFCRGVVRLLREGSVRYLASRPAAITWRRIRRTIFRPFHQSVPVTRLSNPASRGDKLSIIVVNWNVPCLRRAFAR